MAKFTVNPPRFDPYKSFKFRIKFSAKRYVAGVSKISGFKRTTEVENREGGDPGSSHKLPQGTKYEPITMERGVTHDPEFEEWANRNIGNTPGDQREKEVSLKDLRRDLTIEVFDEAGQKMFAYKVFRAWVSEFTAHADLDARRTRS